jgi:hypothetical protein
LSKIITAILLAALTVMPSYAAKVGKAAAKPALHPLQNRLKGYWASSGTDKELWEFQPGKGNAGVLYVWFKNSSYHKRPFLLKGQNQLVIPKLKLTFGIAFERGMLVLSQGNNKRVFRKES